MGRIIFINASPRKENCTKMIDYALPLIKQKGHNADIINLSEKKINFCQDCGFCKKEDYCKQKDDCNKINEHLCKADAIVFVTPVYFGSMSGQLKALIDRTIPLRRSSRFKLKDKLGTVFAVGGSRNGGQEFTISNVMNAMHIHGMIVVGDDGHFGGIVHSPFNKDEIGKETIKGTVEKICRLLRN